VIQNEAEKKLKCKNLSTEIRRMWNMNCFVVPVTTGANGLVTKGLKNIWKQYQESVQYTLYKTQLHITRKVL